MDNDGRDLQDSESISSDHRNPLPIVPSNPLAAASLTLSLSTPLPANFFLQPRISTLFSQPPSSVKVPTQASSLARLSLSSSPLSPSKLSFKSTVSASPLHNPLSLGPRRPLDPSNGAAVRRASIVWFRNDLRVHDNECLNTACNESMSVLPVYCFDPRDYGKSSSGFDKTGPYRATFLIESVSDLRKNLQARGSDLVVRVGRPETVLVELAKAIGADAVYAHREISHSEVKAEEKMEAAMKEENVEVKYFWGSTLYHFDDLPFELENMPTNYGGFKEKVKGLNVRKTIEALDRIKGLPARGDVEAGDIPSPVDLGLNPSATMAQDGRSAADASMAGGETEALQRLKKFAAECRANPPKVSKNGGRDSIYGANFSCKISPWLTMGCLSPRSIFDELNKTASRYGFKKPVLFLSYASKVDESIFSFSNRDDDSGRGSGTNWLMLELMWRDFFRFITKKCNSPKKLQGTPITACTGVSV